MTQEELDALMSGDVDIDNIAQEEDTQEEKKDKKCPGSDDICPPPADDKHRVVAQLDEVTRESEEKAVQILDIMDQIYESVEGANNDLQDVMKFLEREKALFTKLHEKFPHIKTFEDELNEIDEMMEKVQKAIEANEATQDNIMMAMDIMQYQDIHRQKIERVINIMRALIRYMNKLFEGKIEDEKRVSSAQHIHGDENEDVVSDDEIEALLEQFGA
ncbi:MAG: hypothetical protein GXO62_08075 [Epsilonproteobacteria bacterium]|nr:hypothetical protein [Campylobacterota bacterium]